MSTNSGTMASNKKSQNRMPDGGKAKFRKDGLSGAADTGPGGNMGKGMGTMKHKQAKYGNKPDKNGAPSGTNGPQSSSAYHRSGGQTN